MGGISIDTHGRVKKSTGEIIPGLFAAGEVSGGIHGDTRLGGNALTECVVFGREVGEFIEITKISETPKNSDISGAGGNSADSKGLRKISEAELASHSSPEDCWMAINGKVFDFSGFAEEHPGGPESIIRLAGKNATEEFFRVHPIGMLEAFDVFGEFKEAGEKD